MTDRLLLPLCLAAVVGLVVYLVPWGSFPVGYDVFRSLLIARTWAEHGFPQSLPEAAFTGLDRRFADQQLGFDALLALVGGRRLDEAWVPPLLWGLVGLQAGAVLGAARLLRRDVSPLWVLVLPAVSQGWLFRCTTLRTMLLAILFLLPLIAVVAARARGGRVGRWWLAVFAGAFTYCHGAVVVPPVLWTVGAVGTRLENGRGSFPWRDGGFLVGGMLAASVLRPDFPANLQVWLELNLGLLQGSFTGQLAVRPSELLPLSLRDLLRTEWTFLLAAGALAWRVATVREARRWSLVLPALFLVAATLTSRRMVEMAAPVLVLALAVAWHGRLRALFSAAAFAVACFVHAPLAAAGAEANRMRELRPVADWLKSRGASGDMVFVTDWGTSSPLAWFTRGSRLRFTGIIDPVFVWAEHPDAWRDWQAIKQARVAEPLALVRERFEARFLVFGIADAPAGMPPGTTADALRDAMGREHASGREFDAFVLYPDRPRDPRNWIAVDFHPP